MKQIDIPYYDGRMTLSVAEKNLKAVISPNIDGCRPALGETETVLASLQNPIGSKRLRELAEGKKKVVLITSDHTRAMPSRITLPLLLAEIREGSPDADITILVATGLHRPTTAEEQQKMFGDEIVGREKIVVSDSGRGEDFVFVSKLPSGAEFHVHRLARECDLLISEGFIEPHFFAGFSGGRKSILPGICSRETVNENHSYQAIAHPASVAGVLEGNPIHADMLFAAREIGLAFICNVALNAEKKITAAFSGDMEAAHDAGVAFVRRVSECRAVTGDIVVTGNGGYPLDQNLYQSVKAVSTADLCAREGGVIVMCCSCCDGIGGEYFGEIMTGGTPAQAMERLSAIPPRETIPEQWNAQVYFKALMKKTVILVSTFLDEEIIKKANMTPAKSLEEAMEIAYRLMGGDAEVVVIPDGVSVMIAG